MAMVAGVGDDIGLAGEDGEVAEGDDVGPVGVTFGEDGGDGVDIALGGVNNSFHSFEGATGTDNVIDEDDFFTFDEGDIFFIEVEGLGFAGGDGDGFGVDGIAHVWFMAFAEDDVREAEEGGHFVGEGDAFGFGGDEDVAAEGGDFFGEGGGGGFGDVGVAEEVKDSDGNTGGYFEEGEVAFEASDGDGMGGTCCHKWYSLVMDRLST